MLTHLRQRFWTASVSARRYGLSASTIHNRLRKKSRQCGAPLKGQTMTRRHRIRLQVIYFSWFGPELFCLLLGPPAFNCWFSFAPVFQWCCSTSKGSPGVGRNTFLSSPHLCFVIVFICDLFTVMIH